MNNLHLNSKQLIAYKKIDQFLKQQEHQIFYLLGYAGTGKTYLMASVILDLLEKQKLDQVFICAPTHKALHVIESYFRSQSNAINSSLKVNFLTVQKLLEFRPTILQSSGSKVFRPMRESKFLKHTENRLVIIDECSMISKEIATELSKYAEMYPVKFIFMGDDAQLPPVKENISKIFAMIPSDYDYFILLEEIMRTNSNVIKKVSQMIRKWKQKTSLIKTLLSLHDAGNINAAFRFYKKGNKIESAKWFKYFISLIKSHRHSIILAWRNPTCLSYNNLIRQHIHSNLDLSTYTSGDCLMFNNFYISSIDHSTYYTSDTVEVISLETKLGILYEWKEHLILDLKTPVDQGFNMLINQFHEMPQEFGIATLVIKKLHSDYDKTLSTPKTIITIQLSDLSLYKTYIENIKEAIIRFNTKFRSEPHTKLLWDIYHKHLIDRYADINFGYSITVHKAQGSTFGVVFVDVDDIIQNPDKSEVKKSIYTATTRASEMLRFLV